MLAEGRFGLKFRPKTMSAKIEGEDAFVEVRGDGPEERATVHCVREAPAWRVEPELPDVARPAAPRRRRHLSYRSSTSPEQCGSQNGSLAPLLLHVPNPSHTALSQNQMRYAAAALSLIWKFTRTRSPCVKPPGRPTIAASIRASTTNVSDAVLAVGAARSVAVMPFVPARVRPPP